MSNISCEDFYFGKLIGVGTFAKVFLVKEVKSNREFAIKVCDKEEINEENRTKYIFRERNILKLIKENWTSNVPYFVRLFASFQDAKRWYFVMTIAKRGNFLEFISKLSSNSIDCTQFYAAQLLSAIEHLHKIGIIHRDLKPENILLNEKMHILITDFGCAKVIEESGNGEEEENDSEGKILQSRQSFVGTPAYVCPEIFSERNSISRASDLWSFGCILYQIISGIPPFQSLIKKMKLEYAFHEGYDENAKDLISKLLKIDPSERFGYNDATYYSSIRNHQFFHDLVFENLHQTLPPCLQEFTNDSDSDVVWSDNIKPGIEKMLELMHNEKKTLDDEFCDSKPMSISSANSAPTMRNSISNRKNSVLKPLVSLNDEERARKLKEQTASNEFHRFVDGNLILKQGLLDKKVGLFARKRMFLLTEGPRLFYVDTNSMVLKGEIPWSAGMKTEIHDFRKFFIHVPGRVYYLIDNESTSKDWCSAINEVKTYYFERDKKD